MYMIECVCVCVCFQLSLKQEAVQQAQEKVGGLQALVDELEEQLEEGRRERESLATAWEQEIANIHSQVKLSSVIVQNLTL